MGWMNAVILLGLVIVSLKQVTKYERGIKFTMGKFSEVVNPGWHLVIPVFQPLKKLSAYQGVRVTSQNASLRKPFGKIKAEFITKYGSA